MIVGRKQMEPPRVPPRYQKAHLWSSMPCFLFLICSAWISKADENWIQQPKHFKVHMFWEGHEIWKNLLLFLTLHTFLISLFNGLSISSTTTISTTTRDHQVLSNVKGIEDYSNFCGLLRIIELFVAA